jgi:hypothetical protein
MRTSLCLCLILTACGGSSTTKPDGGTHPDGGTTVDAANPVDGGASADAYPMGLIGSACDRNNMGVWQTECPGMTNAICEAIDECGSGFCSQKCDTASCPSGSVCLTLTQIDPATLGTRDVKRCFLACDSSAPVSTCPGLTACFPGYEVCASGVLLSNFGSTGGKGPGGAACSSPAPDPGMAPRLFSANVAVSSTDGNEAGVAIGSDGTMYTGWNVGGFARSTNGGASWTELGNDDPQNAGDPSIAVDPVTHRVYYAHLASVGAGACVAGAAYPSGLGVDVGISDDQGNTWSHLTQVTPAAESAGDQGVDKPWIAVVPTDGTVLISYEQGSNLETATTSRMVVARSVDHGLTFTETEVDPGRPTFRNLMQLAVTAGGVVYATWWDGDVNGTLGQVRLSKSLDSGATWSPAVMVTGNVAIFDVPGLAVSPDGNTIAITWAQPAMPPGIDVEDVYATVSKDGGATFLPAVRVNDDPTCATHWHPFPAARDNGDVYVLWYDNRYGDGRVMWARGTTTASALTFAAGDDGFVNDVTQPFTTSRGRFFVGDYIGVALSGQTLLAAWGDLRDASASVQSRIFAATAILP